MLKGDNMQDSILFNIDQIEINNGNRLTIKGWCFSSHGNCLVRVIDGDEIHEVQISVRRDDVINGLSIISDSSLIGFEKTFDLKYNEKIQVEFYMTEAKISKTISYDCDALRKDDVIKFSVDQVVLKDDKVHVFGWCISENNNSITISDMNQSIDLVRRFGRYDLATVFGNEVDYVDAGFELIYKKHEIDTISLQFSTGNCSLNSTIRLEEYLDQSTGKDTSGFAKLLNYRNLSKVLKMIQKEGLVFTLNKIKNKLHEPLARTYTLSEWERINLPTETEISRQKEDVIKRNPKISIIVPTYNTEKRFLDELITSVKEQTYSNWELCLGDGSTSLTTREYLDKFKIEDSRIKIYHASENLGIAGNTIKAFELSTGDYYVLLDHDDILTPDALYEVVKAFDSDETLDFIYSDRLIFSDKTQEVIAIHNLPDFSPDLFRCYNYASHLNAFSKHIVDLVGFERVGYDGSQDYEFQLRVIEKARNIKHIRKILYYCRACEGSVAFDPESKMYAYEAGQRAISEHIERMGFPGNVKFDINTFSYKIDYEIKKPFSVAIVIPNKDHFHDLKRAVDSILLKSTYKNYHIYIVENNSTDKAIFEYYNLLRNNSRISILDYNNKGFNFSDINNWAVEQIKEDYVILLNNDVEVITPDWIEEMLMLCQRDDVGVVGAKLYFQDHRIQHSGLIVGIGGNIASHYEHKFDRQSSGYLNRLNLVHNYTALTAACMMVSREDYLSVNGLDAEKFKVGLNDVDFCLKLIEKGKINVFTPHAELFHYESLSRGSDEFSENQRRFDLECRSFREKWAQYFISGDPYDYHE